jgi:anthranilate phosphoribosyltransferase
MKHAAPVRKELGVRTLFNILGPLTNPAGAPNQLLGVFHPDLVGILVRVLQRLGSEHAVVVHGLDGLDEVSLSGETLVGELKDGQISEYAIHPGDLGLKAAPLDALRVDGPQQSIELMHEALNDVDGPARDIVVLNAGVALYAANVAASLSDGVQMARAAISSGAARDKLHEFVRVTRSLQPVAADGA